MPALIYVFVDHSTTQECLQKLRGVNFTLKQEVSSENSNRKMFFLIVFASSWLKNVEKNTHLARFSPKSATIVQISIVTSRFITLQMCHLLFPNSK